MRRQTLAMAIGLLLLAGCRDADGGGRATLATGADGGVRRAASPMVQQAAGVTHLPLPIDEEAFNASLRRHYPAELRAQGRGGAVLADVRLDARGIVRGVEILTTRASTAAGEAGDDEHRVVLLDERDGRAIEREAQLAYDPAFAEAARAVLQEARFLPALRDGRAVPFTLRMTVSFDPPTHTSSPTRR